MGDGTAGYLGYGGSYITLCICQNSKNCILKSFTLCK